jgi:hypothetical protein
VSSASDITVVKELATGQDTIEVAQAQQECSHTTNIQLTDLHTRPTQTTDQTQSSEMSYVITECNDLAQVHIFRQQYEFEKACLTQVNVKCNLKKHLNF